MSLATQAVQARGPATNHPSSLASGNPYKCPPQLLEAAKLPPKVTKTHIYFFGYEGPDPHVCFQQWFPCMFTARVWTATDVNHPSGPRQEFGSTEQVIMHAKAMLMGDEETATKIANATHPSEAKLLSRQVRDFDQERWNSRCEAIVAEANHAKFSQNEDLKLVLLGTGERIIVEASPDDRIWGISFDAATAEGKEAEWGKNLLEKVLMRVRTRLSESSSA